MVGSVVEGFVEGGFIVVGGTVVGAVVGSVVLLGFVVFGSVVRFLVVLSVVDSSSVVSSYEVTTGSVETKMFASPFSPPVSSMTSAKVLLSSPL